MPPEKVLILVVDDDRDILNLLREDLEYEGYEIITAGNGQTAVNLFAEKQPALILLDILMPEMDGFEVYQRIRQSSRARLSWSPLNTARKIKQTVWMPGRTII